jgi:OOP family OmpA-OmpF porin
LISSTECQLQESELKKISELEKYISHNPEKRLLVIGHSDNTGNDLINNEMSNERAVFMKLKLVEGGIDPDIIEVYSKGSSDPVADNNTATGRLMNRRAETIIK